MDGTEIFEIVILSLLVSGLAGVASSLSGLLLSLWLFLGKSHFKDKIIDFFRALTGVPSVIFGLLVLLLLSRRGFLGHLGLLFTPTAIVIAQYFLLLPLAVTLSIDILNSHGKRLLTTCKVLQIPRKKIPFLLFKELKSNFLGIFLVVFSRGISEVGAVMLVGGNIKGATRVMTTYISLSTSMGNYDTSLAIAAILFILSYALNYAIRRIK